MRTLKLLAVAAFGVAAITVLAGCQRENPAVIYMPDMVYSPAYKAQEEGSMRLPPEGTVPRGFEPYQYAALDRDEAGPKLGANPLPRTKANLLRGQALYNTYCIVCHGPKGEGDGTIVPKFPRPPSLQSDKVRAWTDGYIYHIVTMGQNLMPSYASQVAQEDRWRIAHYLRVLHRAENPTPDDLAAFAKESE